MGIKAAGLIAAAGVDAASVDLDDNDRDILIEIRLVPARPPVTP
jgi:hypothetical protein